MKKIIFLKYGELSTKKDNRNYFLKTLKSNIENICTDTLIEYDYGRMFLIPKENEYEVLESKLKKVFGIHKIVTGFLYKEKDIDSIKKNVMNLIREEKFNSFKVETKRSDKTYELKSMEISKIIGETVFESLSSINVDLKNPDLTINIEIRKNEVLIYLKETDGLKGYPVSSLGKGLLMLSGGIDSPVSGYLAMKRGVKLEAIYFESPPHTSEMAKNKVVELSRILSEYNNGIKLHVINFTEIQEAIYKNIPHEYLITIMRRMMYRISAIVSSNSNGKIIINGESIGQVASQTLSSMAVINEVIKMPVIRPVACFDKLEIIDLAKRINTYETSILPYEDCCTIFVPEHPVINPMLTKCQEYEELIDYKNMIYRCIKNHEIIKIEHKKEEKYQDLL